jgi:hypothetical protein
VQFYEHEDELAAGVGPYLVEGIQTAGGAAIVIAIDAHRRAFAARLAAAGIDPELARGGLSPTGPALVMLDAREAADALLVAGRIATDRFEALIGDLVREAAADNRPVRAYGEIVAVLWADGHVRAALELEELWNGLGREVEFSLYCAYPRSWVAAGSDAFHQVCRRHSGVVGPPATPAPRGSDPLPPEGPPLELEAPFRWSGRSPAAARRFVTETLVAWGCAAIAGDAALIVSELATNAVIHAQTAFTVALSRRPGGLIRIAVRDASPVRPLPRQAGSRDSSGRGLSLVARLAVGWGSERVPGGKTVWAELDEARVGERSRPAGATLTPG